MTTARDVIADEVAGVISSAQRAYKEHEECADAILTALKAAPDSVRHELAALLNPWRPMSEARKNGTPILLKFKANVPHAHDDVRPWDGLQFVGRHPGLAEDGFDIGWDFAAPVGHGGFPDDWFEGWLPLPSPPKEDKP